MCLSVKLHLCRLLLTQYINTRLVRIGLRSLVGRGRYVLGLVLTSERILSEKLYF